MIPISHILALSGLDLLRARVEPLLGRGPREERDPARI